MRLKVQISSLQACCHLCPFETSRWFFSQWNGRVQGYKKMIPAGLPNVLSMTMVIMVIMVIMAMIMIMAMVTMVMGIMERMAMIMVIITKDFAMTQVLELAVSRLQKALVKKQHMFMFFVSPQECCWGAVENSSCVCLTCFFLLFETIPLIAEILHQLILVDNGSPLFATVLYIPGITQLAIYKRYIANWVILCYLPPIKGTRKLHWSMNLPE